MQREGHGLLLCELLTLFPAGKPEKPGAQLVPSPFLGNTRGREGLPAWWAGRFAVRDREEKDSQMNDLVLHAEKTAEKQDVEEQLRSGISPCSSCQRSNHGAEVKCDHPSYNSTAARAGRWQVTRPGIYSLKSGTPHQKISACQ